MVDDQFGPYRLDRLLGRGGMGEVYLAFDSSHQRAVAIKLLLEGLSSDPNYRERFEREARIVAGLREQHIIPIHCYGEIDNRLYIDMRLVDGEDLGKLLAREGALSPRRAVGIVQQVAAALDAAHRAGLIHRDVKPANVLIANIEDRVSDAVYLADFGIARETVPSTHAELTTTGSALGTPAYMAPERFTARTIDHRADIYALGCMLYEMLSGQRPFRGEEWLAVAYKHANADPPRPSTVQSGIPAAMDLVISTSMAKDPASRYRTAGELAAAADIALAPVVANNHYAVIPTRTGTVEPRRADKSLDSPPHQRPPTAAAAAPSRSPSTPAVRHTPLLPHSRNTGRASSPAKGGGPAPHLDWVPVATGRRWSKWFYNVDHASDHPATHVWPTATDYVHAVQIAAEPVSMAALRNSRIVRDPLGMPASSSGQNAIVFELSHAAGGLALRCFTRSPTDASARYRALAPVLASTGCDIVAPARWLDSAINVGGEHWPAVIMPWVPGLPLNTAVEDLLDHPERLKRVADSWLRGLSELSAAGLAHGDLQCGNVLVDQNGELHLVDLDGFYVPSLTKPPAELGHPDFQHPRRAARDWGPDMDGFSGLVIYLSLRALATDSDLWRFNSAENLILTREDYERPGKTTVWTDLCASTDPEVVRLTGLLARHCRAATPPTLAEVLSQLGHPDSRATPSKPRPSRATAETMIPSSLDVEQWWVDGPQTAALEIEPTAAPRVGGWFGRNSIVTGLTSGLACAALVIAVYAVIGHAIPATAQSPLLVALCGSILTAALAAIPRATMGAWQSARKLGREGAALGATLSLAALGGFELVAYGLIEAGRATLLLVTAWTLCALSIGAASGIVRRSGRAVVSGLLGGVVGGLAGGVIHWASGPTFVDTGTGYALALDVLSPSTLIAICLACAAIGLSIGLVDRVRRRSWLTVIEGSLRGREVILDHRETTIGTVNTATLRLAGDAGVEQTHAVLSSDQGIYAVRCHAPVEVNGVACATSAPVQLRSGDVLRVGGSFIRFEQRESA